LNAFIEKVKVESFGAIDIEPFTPENMNKLAFMCATGARVIIVTGCINALAVRVSETFIKNNSCIA
jgi:phosphoserine phosphatase